MSYALGLELLEVNRHPLYPKLCQSRAHMFTISSTCMIGVITLSLYLNPICAQPATRYLPLTSGGGKLVQELGYSFFNTTQ